MTVKLAQHCDCDTLALLCRENFSQPWSKDSFTAEIDKGSYILMAYENNEPIGFAVLENMMGDGYLHLLTVNELYRRRGIATELMTELHKVAEQNDIDQILLEVRGSNSAAQKLYSALGYKKIAVRRDFYSYPREDGVTMQKVIK